MKSLFLLAQLTGMAGAVQAAQLPQEIFDRTCSLCHNGQSTAPRTGDAEAWQPRLAQGMDTLVLHVTEGYNGMPPRGLCMDCTAEDFKAVITLMSD